MTRTNKAWLVLGLLHQLPLIIIHDHLGPRILAIVLSFAVPTFLFFVIKRDQAAVKKALEDAEMLFWVEYHQAVNHPPVTTDEPDWT